MYIEMVDETGQVSDEILKQTQEILEFAAQKIGKEDKEMAVTFVTNECIYRSYWHAAPNRPYL